MNYDLETREGMSNAVLWTRNTLALLRVGGVWGVPRSGVMVTKTGFDSVALSDADADPSITRVIKAAGFSIEGDRDE